MLLSAASPAAGLTTFPLSFFPLTASTAAIVTRFIHSVHHKILLLPRLVQTDEVGLGALIQLCRRRRRRLLCLLCWRCRRRRRLLLSVAIVGAEFAANNADIGGKATAAAAAAGIGPAPHILSAPASVVSWPHVDFNAVLLLLLVGLLVFCLILWMVVGSPGKSPDSHNSILKHCWPTHGFSAIKREIEETHAHSALPRNWPKSE